MQLLVERVDVRMHGVEVPLRPNGLAGLVREVAGNRRAAPARTERRFRPIAVHITLAFRKRGGRKLVVTPDGAEWAPRPQFDNAMVKALARAFRWRKMLDKGMPATVEDLAWAKGVHATYVRRILRLTLLAPEIVEAIPTGGSRAFGSATLAALSISPTSIRQRTDCGVVPELAFRLSTREFREHHKALIGSLIAWARELGRTDCAEVLEQTLAEESKRSADPLRCEA